MRDLSKHMRSATLRLSVMTIGAASLFRNLTKANSSG